MSGRVNSQQHTVCKYSSASPRIFTGHLSTHYPSANPHSMTTRLLASTDDTPVCLLKIKHTRDNFVSQRGWITEMKADLVT